MTTFNGKEYTDAQVEAALAAMEAQQAQQNQQPVVETAEVAVDNKKARWIKNAKTGALVVGIALFSGLTAVAIKDIALPKFFGKSSHDDYYDDADEDTIEL